MSMVGRIVTSSSLAILMLAAASSAPALAECIGASVYYGNLSALSWVQLDLKDPAAFYHVYMYENANINEGAARLSDVAFDVSGQYGYPSESALVFADWAAGLGMSGCPLSLDYNGNGILDDDNVHLVLLFGESRRATVAVLGSIQNVFDLDTTLPAGGQLATTSLKPKIIARQGTEAGVLISLQWDPSVINTDDRSQELAAALFVRYQIIEQVRRNGVLVVEQELQDQDGDSTNNAAQVIVTQRCEIDHRVVLQATLGAAGGEAAGASFRGVPSDYLFYIAFPAFEFISDFDRDGWGACGGGDCDDARADIHPGTMELCDLVDNDCNERVDDLAPIICGIGECRNSVTACIDGALQTCTPGSPAQEVCDGLDNDCNGTSDDIDVDGDGFSVCGADCDDADPLVNPGASEVCNGIDDDCDRAIDEDSAGLDSDGDSVPNACDNCRRAYNPSQVDSDGDGIGNACDNCLTLVNVDQHDLDSDGRGDLCDNCRTEFNPFQDDGDADGVGDVCDDCISTPNSSQRDSDGDREGDACDLDDGLLQFTDVEADALAWQPETVYSLFNLYRGDLGVLRAIGAYTQPDGSPGTARFCALADAFALDDYLPTPQGTVFYLVTGVAAGVESSLGENSSGVQRLNAFPCP